MRILVDIAHPAHVHFFRHAIAQWRADGDDVLITSRDKDVALALLAEFGLEHTPIGRARSGIVGLGVELLRRGWGIHRVVSEFRPHVGAAIGGTFLVYGCLLKRVPTVVFTDTEYAPSNAITFPFATAIVTPDAFRRSVGRKQLRYAGFHELAYTHPHIFKPDAKALAKEGLENGEPFTIIRAVNWQAGHDAGHHGIQDLYAVVETLAQYGRVLLSSEQSLPDDLRSLALRGPKRNMLHLQAFARLFLGEGATMASECALLGVPAIFLSTLEPGYISELQDRFGLAFRFNDPKQGQAQALTKARELLEDPDTLTRWRERREKLLAETVDVTQFVVDTVRQYAT